MTSQPDSPVSGYHPANCPVIQVPSLLLEEAGSRKKECPACTGDLALGCGLSRRPPALRHGYRSLQSWVGFSALYGHRAS